MKGALPIIGRRRAARLISRAVFGALLALLLLVPVPYGAVEPWWAAAFEAAVFALAAVWAVEGALAGRWFTHAHLAAVPLLALSLYALAQSLPLHAGQPVSFDPFESRLFARRLLALTLYGALLLRYTNTERRLRALVCTAVAAGLAAALFGIARQAGQQEELGFVLPLLRRGAGYAQFINRNHFAYLAEMSLGLVLGLAAWRGVARGSLPITFAAALPLWAALVLSNSRGGIFAMLCMLGLLAAAFLTGGRGLEAVRPGAGDPLPARAARSKAVRLVLAALLMTAVVVGIAWVGGEPLAERMETVRTEVSAERSIPARVLRAEMWEDTWRLVAARPLTGVGFGGYWVAIRSTHRGSGAMSPRQAHNDYLELLASGGIVGAALVLGFISLLARRARARLRFGTPFAKAAALGALAGLSGVAVHSLVDFGLHLTGNAAVFTALLAILVADPAGGTGGGQKTSPPVY